VIHQRRRCFFEAEAPSALFRGYGVEASHSEPSWVQPSINRCGTVDSSASTGRDDVRESEFGMRGNPRRSALRICGAQQMEMAAPSRHDCRSCRRREAQDRTRAKPCAIAAMVRTYLNASVTMTTGASSHFAISRSSLRRRLASPNRTVPIIPSITARSASAKPRESRKHGCRGHHPAVEVVRSNARRALMNKWDRDSRGRTERGNVQSRARIARSANGRGSLADAAASRSDDEARNFVAAGIARRDSTTSRG